MRTALLLLLLGGDPPGDAVAVVEGTPITRAALEQRARGALAQLRQQEYETRRQALEALVAEELLKREAARRGVTVEELLKKEVEEKVAPVTAEQVQAQYAAVKARLGPRSEEDGKKLVERNLAQQRQNERRAAFLRELRGKAGVRILLEPPRVAVEVADAPTKGSAGAPVTIVEFSDFECPFCVRARATLKRIAEVYGDKVRIAFRDYPLPNHAKAPKAAEAADCAGDQGKFWEMHDKLFGASPKLDVADLKRYAGELGLDAAGFDACLDDGRHAASVKADVEAGAGYGVSATPAFFINGRLLSGAQPFERFAEVIDDELQRTGAATAPTQ
ncbi:MAG TPA: thioredoxin domain-containing protein [Vicinamibacteria bacterium]|nr:thioredoxin domain-containing protein [Vicinamibacteria bacterium]